MFEMLWINIRGTRMIVSAELEFLNIKLIDALRYYKIAFQAGPDRHHNQVGVLESKHSVLRILVQRLVNDAEYFSTTRSVPGFKGEIDSRGILLSNVFHGNKNTRSPHFGEEVPSMHYWPSPE